MKAKLIDTYNKRQVEENGKIKFIPKARYEVLGEENIQAYLDNVQPQYHRFVDEEATRPIFHTRIYKKTPDSEIVVLWNEEREQHESPNIRADRDALIASFAFTAENLL
jgi:hypothetical protein